MTQNAIKFIGAVFIISLLTSALPDSAVAAGKTVVFTDINEALGYNPGITYKGEYIQSRIYYHNPNSPIWLRMSLSDNYRDVVTCQAALVSLESIGKWQGHLRQDGSCGPNDEPSYFALGNRINYDISLDQDVSSN